VHSREDEFIYVLEGRGHSNKSKARCLS
jgi:uncharacterized cupin superfamily protein